MWYEDKVNQGQVELGDQLEGVPHIVAHVECVRATLPYCSQCDSVPCLVRLVPLVTSSRLIPDC